MPIYEFYCPRCHTLFSFWSKTVNTEKRPRCPECKKDTLQRRLSSFATISSRPAGDEKSADDLPIDETKMENAMAALASEAESMEGEDPKAAARLMRKFSDLTGLRYGDGMEEALGRLESGEDPEAIEAEMGDLLSEEEPPFTLPGKKPQRRTSGPPRQDDTLYEM